MNLDLFQKTGAVVVNIPISLNVFSWRRNIGINAKLPNELIWEKDVYTLLYRNRNVCEIAYQQSVANASANREKPLGRGYGSDNVCVCVCVYGIELVDGRNLPEGGQHVDGVNTRSRDTSEVRKSKEPTHPRLRSLKTLAVCLPQASDDLVQLLLYLQRRYSKFSTNLRDVKAPRYPKISVYILNIIFFLWGRKKEWKTSLCEHRGRFLKENSVEVALKLSRGRFRRP